MRYEVHLYYDGPAFCDDAVIQVEADSETDAVREALACAGLAKVGEVRQA